MKYREQSVCGFKKKKRRDLISIDFKQAGKYEMMVNKKVLSYLYSRCCTLKYFTFSSANPVDSSLTDIPDCSHFSPRSSMGFRQMTKSSDSICEASLLTS